MLEDKIESYKKDIAIARSLARNESADGEYYNSIAAKLERILNFYESLRILSRETKEF